MKRDGLSFCKSTISFAVGYRGVKISRCLFLQVRILLCLIATQYVLRLIATHADRRHSLNIGAGSC